MAQVQVESRLTEKRRYEMIKNYVRKYPGKKTKADVMRYMREWTSDPTTFKDLTNLIKAGAILVLKDKPNSQIHYLILNSNDKFNILEDRIDETFKAMVTTFEHYPNLFKSIMQFREFGILHQLMIYSVITSIAKQIAQGIEPSQKREALYPRLIELLEFSDRINTMLAPSLFPDVNEFLSKIKVTPKNERRVKDLKISYGNIKKMYQHLRSNAA